MICVTTFQEVLAQSLSVTKTSEVVSSDCKNNFIEKQELAPKHLKIAISLNFDCSLVLTVIRIEIAPKKKEDNPNRII